MGCKSCGDKFTSPADHQWEKFDESNRQKVAEFANSHCWECAIELAIGNVSISAASSLNFFTTGGGIRVIRSPKGL